MKKLGLFLTIIIIFCSGNASAQFSPADRIQNEQQRLIDEEFRRRDLERTLRPTTSEKISVEEPYTEPEITPTACVNIKTINFSGNDKLSCCQYEENEIRSKYENRCLNLNDIDALLQEITNFYISRGNITSRAYMVMPQKKLKEGILEIKIVEGKVSKIEGIKKTMRWTAFPFITGKILNLRDIEQGLDQINRLASNQATMDIKPDEEEANASKIVINNEAKNSTRFNFFGDNAGSEATGETRYGFRASQDNLFQLNDQLFMTYTTSPSQNRHHRTANSLAVGASIPFGYWTLNNNFSWSNYRTSFILVNGDRYNSYGNSVTNNISLERILSRGQKYKLSTGLGLTYKRNQNYSKILDLKLKNESSSRDLAIFNADLPVTFYTSYGVIFLKPSYHQGIRMFSALRDDEHNYSQKAQYHALKLYAYYSNYFGPFNFTTAFDGQYSNDELYGSEAFYIGGEYTVRGFKEDGFQGDSGYTLRNDLTLNLGNAFRTQNEILQAITPGIFLDYGYAHSNHPSIKSEILSGAGAKIEVNYKFFEGSLSYAEPLKKADWMNENKVWYIYAGLGFKF